MQWRYIFVLPVLSLVPVSGQAQPISWGMAQCSALMGVMEQHVNSQPHKTYLGDAASVLMQAALEKGRVEGQDAAQLDRVRGDKQHEWDAMGYSMAFKTEFRDWVDYCKALARAHDIALDKSMLH